MHCGPGGVSAAMNARCPKDTAGLQADKSSLTSRQTPGVPHWKYREVFTSKRNAVPPPPHHPPPCPPTPPPLLPPPNLPPPPLRSTRAPGPRSDDQHTTTRTFAHSRQTAEVLEGLSPPPFVCVGSKTVALLTHTTKRKTNTTQDRQYVDDHHMELLHPSHLEKMTEFPNPTV